MTNITVEKKGDRHILHIEGHAGYGTHGNDIVCAAVSILGYTWLNELLIMEERKQVKNVSYEEDNGKLLIEFSGGDNAVNTAYETILTGFEALQQNYSENITLKRGAQVF
ncbi:ribosomal-processing cysteine protease Prp [bacterium]|jgi:uncharacterized protein YsxB (DUF464 family)|nr:ribosomal-processing cysteine protease Prp [bacterium]DAV71493.1 MAG TPA: YsxB-like protein [Caudoviricetes sp.]